MTSNNIIVFPNSTTTPSSIEEMRELIDENKRDAIELAIDEVIPELLNKLGSFNLYIDNEKDIGMIVEAIKSGLLRSNNIKHELQSITDRLIKII